jgi:putative intracellular protease/amidase
MEDDILLSAIDLRVGVKAQGPQAVADYALAECPKLDVILVPGGIGTRKQVQNDVALEWLRRRSRDRNLGLHGCGAPGAGTFARRA